MKDNKLINDALKALASDLEHIVLDDVEKEIVKTFRQVLLAFTKRDSTDLERIFFKELLCYWYPGQLARMIVEFDYSKISVETGALIINAEKAFFNGRVR